MKKITFILLVLLTGTAFGQKSAEGTAQGKAHIVKPIGIANPTTSILDFGKLIAPTGASGTASITATAAPTRTLSNLEALGTAVTNVVFEVSASANNSYYFSLPNIQLTGDGDPMDLALTSSLGTTTTGLKGDKTIYVGGTLTVNDGQKEGDYIGVITATVAYE